MGLTPMEAIVGATSVGARIGGFNTGLVAAGRQADFIVLNANPLEDIRLLENVKFVMKDGKIYKQEP